MNFIDVDSSQTNNFSVEHVYIAGWTARNKQSVDHHIQELAELGISPPSKVPLYYRVSNRLLTQDDNIEVLGITTSGEVEPLLIQHKGNIWIGLASDHTDRELEAYSVAASKQACLKPISKQLWNFHSVKDHLDSLILRCMINEDNQWTLYQEGSLETIRPLVELIRDSGFGDNAAMLCGTLAAKGGVRPANAYKMELLDPVLDRKIHLDYTVRTLPIVK
ncbi:MAG: DUF2848 domain-containing protein [Granulosicoccus sp.]